MAKGGARVGAGRPRKPVSQHLLEGTFRVDRHGARPTNVVPLPVQAPDWQPEESDVDVLAPQARRWLANVLAFYQLSPIEGEVLLLALRSMTRLEQMEAAVATEGVTTDGGPHPLLAALAREARVFLTLWQALRLEK